MTNKPSFITITESFPASVDHYKLRAFEQDLSALLSEATYAADASGTTVIPIGTNGFLDTMPEAKFFVMKLIEIKGTTEGPQQSVPGGPFQKLAQPDGAESIVVTV